MDSNNTGRWASLALAAVMGLAVAGGAWAAPGGHSGHGGHGGFHGGHSHFHGRSHVGVWVGSTWGYGYGPGWYGDPWYGYPYPYGRTLIVQPPLVVPPVYIEQGGEPTAQMWYYCARPQGYYPYVTNCSAAWRAVLPTSVR